MSGTPTSINLALSGEQRYRQAMRKARLQFQRDIRSLIETGKSMDRCGMDLERDAIIAEFDRLVHALNAAPLLPQQD